MLNTPSNKLPSSELSRKQRIVLSLIYVFPVLFIDLALSFFLGIGGGKLTGPFLLASIAFVFIIPHLRLNHRYLTVNIQLALILSWFILMSLFLPVIKKPYHIALAEQFLPPNAVLTVGKIDFHPGNEFTSGPGVWYWYNSKIPQADYQKMRAYYISYLTQRGWRIDTEETGDRPHVGFVKEGDGRIVNIYLENDQNYPIQLSVGFD